MRYFIFQNVMPLACWPTLTDAASLASSGAMTS
jgi:hypothetical protein